MMYPKTLICLVLCSILTFSPVMAQDASNRWVVDLGRSSSNASRGHAEFDVYRLGVQKPFRRTFWEGDSAKLGGYWEGSLNFWSASSQDEYALAVSPVFVLSFGEGGSGYQPFIEAGIGLAILSDDVIAGRQMGSSWQFEDRIGFGLRSDRMGFHYRYMHYSNADIDKPNQGIDAHVIGMTYRF